MLVTVIEEELASHNGGRGRGRPFPPIAVVQGQKIWTVCKQERSPQDHVSLGKGSAGKESSTGLWDGRRLDFYGGDAPAVFP